MEPVPRILGLDVGTRTIGVAVSDPMGWFARGITTIRRQSWKEDLAQIEQILTQFEAQHLVVGLPLGSQGEMTEQARYSKGAAERILAEFPHLRISYIDESYSTENAKESLRATGMKRSKRKAIIDQQAAVLILQDFLDQEQRRVQAQANRAQYNTTN
jgi:putative holliday junction resolvase